MKDDIIVDLFIKRDETALSACGEKYGKSLRTIAKNILQDEESAKECENDTYFKAWNLIPPNEPRTYLFAFLARIARHISIDRCRSNSAAKRSAKLVELSSELQQCIEDENAAVEAVIARGELEGIISEFLRRLPKDERQLFVRRYWYMDSVADLAKMFGFSDSKVKTTLFRTRKKLAEVLNKEGYTV